jgi:hypothetical protein
MAVAADSAGNHPSPHRKMSFGGHGTLMPPGRLPSHEESVPNALCSTSCYSQTQFLIRRRRSPT